MAETLHVVVGVVLILAGVAQVRRPHRHLVIEARTWILTIGSGWWVIGGWVMIGLGVVEVLLTTVLG